MQRRSLGRTGLSVSPVGFGAFKIGRNQGIKYPAGYELPGEAEVERLLNGVLDLGVCHVDTAPAYGLSEERIGRAIAHRRSEFVLSTKVGESFENGRSTYDFSAIATRTSVERSLQRLRTDTLDVVFVHSNGRDGEILESTDVVPALLSLKSKGHVRAVGFSGKTPHGTRAALTWADVVMVEYNPGERAFESVVVEAARRDVGVVVKKALGSGHLDPGESIRFVLDNPGVTNLVVGTLSLEHLRQNVQVAAGCRSEEAA